MRLSADHIISAIFITIFVLALYGVSGERWQVSLAPILVAGGGLCLLTLDLLRSARGGPKLERARGLGSLRDEVISYFWVALAVICVVALGFSIGGGLYVFAFISVNGSGYRRWIVATVSAICVIATVEFLFIRLLQISLFEGLFFL